MKIISSGATDIGRVRKSNQDSICLEPNLNFFVVADGMGGHNGGDIASQMSVKLLPEYITKHKNQLDDPEQLLSESIQFVNESLFEHANQNTELKGMGTTIICALLKENKIYFGNLGDSRAYMFKNKSLFQMSKDHSLVQEKLNMGIYDREAAKKDPKKNVLIRTVGFEEGTTPDIFNYQYGPGDLFLLCSDGLHGKVSDSDILHIINDKVLSKNSIKQENLDQAVQELISQANNNGGQDNISVILIQV